MRKFVKWWEEMAVSENVFCKRLCVRLKFARKVSEPFFYPFFTILLDGFQIVFSPSAIISIGVSKSFSRKPFCQTNAKVTLAIVFEENWPTGFFSRNISKSRQLFHARLLFLHRKSFLQVHEESCETFWKVWTFFLSFCHHYCFC